MRTLQKVSRFLAIAGAAFLCPESLPAQDASEWQAFYGCWTPAEAASEVVLCFSPAGDGVELVTVVDGVVVSSEVLVADGQPRLTEAAECSGSREVRFSSDVRRVFTRSSLECGEGPRTGAGVMAFVSPTRWVDVRALELGGEPAVWAEEYGPVDRGWYGEHGIRDAAAANVAAVRERRVVSAAPIDTADVGEALSRVDHVAVEMWIAFSPVRFDLDGDAIIALADGGVPESVVDVMVARSFPERFAINLDDAPTVAEVPPPPRPAAYPAFYGPRSYFFDPFYYDPGFYGYTGYNIYGYSTYPFGTYRPRPFYPYYPGGNVIIVNPSADGPADRGGRMVNGRGYQGNSGGGAVAPRSNSQTSVAPAAPAPTTTRSASGTVSPSPPNDPAPEPSSGGTPTGRRARPR